MIPQNSENGHFSKLEYGGGAYQETYKYITTQPLGDRKKGFGTRDAKRRDEFSSAVRTEQYRTTIKKENDMVARGSEKLQDTLQDILARRTSTAPEATSKYAIDVPKFDIGRTRVTPFDPKSTKDTYYKFDSTQEKRFGDYKPASLSFGDGTWDYPYKPPQHGGKSETKNFFDKSHLVV